MLLGGWGPQHNAVCSQLEAGWMGTTLTVSRGVSWPSGWKKYVYWVALGLS